MKILVEILVKKEQAILNCDKKNEEEKKLKKKLFVFYIHCKQVKTRNKNTET